MEILRNADIAGGEFHTGDIVTPPPLTGRRYAINALRVIGKRRINHSPGPSNINLGIFVRSFEVPWVN